MHYHCEAWIPIKKNYKKQVENIMLPYYEETHPRKGFWDWYQIGGRWTGAHKPSYQPEADPRNHEFCTLCEGTGFRNDFIGMEARANNPSYTCNACGHFNSETKKWEHGEAGAGVKVKWPTQWKPAACDVIPVSMARDDLSCYTLIVGKRLFQSEVWNGKTFVETSFDGYVKAVLNTLNITTGYLVTVDYHS